MKKWVLMAIIGLLLSGCLSARGQKDLSDPATGKTQVSSSIRDPRGDIFRGD